MSVETQRGQTTHPVSNSTSEDVPKNLALFARGVWAMLTIWSALRIAMEHFQDEADAEYEDTAEGKKRRLLEELVDAFYICKDQRGNYYLIL